jgi:peptidoglycan/xylan/chitin deacetylase (PgdA/CDA1 family)
MNAGTRMLSRRQWMAGTAAMAASRLTGTAAVCSAPRQAQVAITLDLEMSRNFPRWEDTQWDFQKGQLDAATKAYASEAGRRVRAHGGRIHYFCVGQVLEQEDVGWLAQLAEDGHPIGNHTYDHVNLLATRPQDLQFRFQRSPWLIDGLTTEQVIRDNIRDCTLALKQRLGIDNRGFRTPGGFQTGLHGREDLQQLLLDAGFRWVSSLYPAHANTAPQKQPSAEVRDSIVKAQAMAQPFRYPTGLLEIPMSPISDIGAFRTGRWQLDWFLDVIRQSVDWAIRHQAVFDFLAHPSCLVAVDPDFRSIELICDLVNQSQGAAKLVDLDAIAASFDPVVTREKQP